MPKNKGGREIRKPKQAKKPKAIDSGSAAEKINTAVTKAK
jgi:hypothetical protein